MLLRAVGSERLLHAERLTVRALTARVLVPHGVAAAAFRAEGGLGCVLLVELDGGVVRAGARVRESLDINVFREQVGLRHPRGVVAMPSRRVGRCGACAVQRACQMVHQGGAL